MIKGLARYTRLEEIVGDIVRVRASDVFLEELAILKNPDGLTSYARVVEIEDDKASLLVFAGTRGISTEAQVQFLGRNFQVVATDHALGRIFNGSCETIDDGPDLTGEEHMEIGGPVVNPVMREVPHRMIRTDIPMIDLFNSLVESQKIPIFSVAGEPYNPLLARIGFQADADIVIFGGLGLIFDDFHFFRTQFEEHGVFHRTIMFVNLASDPIVERLLVPDMALAVAERFAVEQKKRVLVLLTDMTAYADALKEIGIAMERIPANRGYTGDLYTQLASRYEKACNFEGAGSITVLTVTTMPGNDVTHPVPDNTGYITEGQFYLHDGVLDPFGSLSRLKQHVIGSVTREDHDQIMNTMIRFYAGSVEAERKRSMAFDLSPFDHKLLKFGALFKERFMNVHVALPFDEALDKAWQTLAECFQPDELLMKQKLIDEYFPESVSSEA